jgi:hypothetical protein
VVTEVKRDEGNTGFDEAAGQESLLTPEVRSVTVTNGTGFLFQVEGLTDTAAGKLLVSREIARWV